MAIDRTAAHLPDVPPLPNRPAPADGTSSPDQIVRRAFAAFRTDVEQPPPLSLRGGDAVDGYQVAEPFDPAVDEPTDAYLEGFAFWGLGYLDAQSWRHYLPRLIAYAFRNPDDPRMAVEALVRTLRPPDRYPPRLTTLTAEQEEVVAAFLEVVALGGAHEALAQDAQQALEEWWLPGARHRASPAELDALRAAPVSWREEQRRAYSISVPASLGSGGPRRIPEEAREVEVWSGLLGGDAHTVVALNLTPLGGRTLQQVLERASRGLRAAGARPAGWSVPGAASAERLDGWTRGDSPAEPQRITLVAAEAGSDAILLSVRSWPRPDVDAALERIVRSFRVHEAE